MLPNVIEGLTEFKKKGFSFIIITNQSGISRKLFTWNEYDAVTRLRDSQLYKDKIDDISRYIKKGKIWQSFEFK